MPDGQLANGFTVGSLVRSRGREWVVLPPQNGDPGPVVRVRPIGGMDDEVTAIHSTLEAVEPATFAAPSLEDIGDHEGGRLLRDAARLSSRACAGPFRSLARIAVEPRPYQYVPLLMAMKLDPVRLMIADDVGIGKTVEACLIARELLDRGEVRRLAVLCPPHLAAQWQAELLLKFHIEAELVLTSTVARLERPCKVGESLFDLYPFVVVSTDFIKGEKRRDEFVRACPELVIVDEAHGCASPEGAGRTQQHRHRLVRDLAADEERHLVLVTATPHSGKHDAFRSLVAFLDEDFANLPETPTTDAEKALRRRLANHFIQRQRGNILEYMGEETRLPRREPPEGRTVEYNLSPAYKRVFNDVLDWAAGELEGQDRRTRTGRVRWWSVLGLLRALGSSPAAAAATLRNRSRSDESDEVETAEDDVQSRTFDLVEDDSEETPDVVPSAEDGVSANALRKIRAKLKEFAESVEQLKPAEDKKLAALVAELKELLKAGYKPLVFCRYVDTAGYVAEQLRSTFKNAEVGEVTGRLPHAEREDRIADLIEAEDKQRILVCTDCLSEGINLQHGFDAVVHYDLSWNPMRHEQREGRVDRFGQENETVRVAALIGLDNEIDRIVMEVLLRKHVAIRSDLGISVALPARSETVIEALGEKLIARRKTQGVLPGFEDYIEDDRRRLHEAWDAAKDREHKNRSIYAQNAIKVDEVREAVASVRQAIGSAGLVKDFVERAVPRLGGVLDQRRKKLVEIDLSHARRAVRNAVSGVGEVKPFKAWYDLPVDDGVAYLARTHPFVEGLSNFVLESTLDEHLDGIGVRAGCSRVDGLERRTTVLLARMRYHLTATAAGHTTPMLVEEVALLGFEGSAEEPQWLAEDDVVALMEKGAAGNVPAEQKKDLVGKALDGRAALATALETIASERCEALRQAHVDIRKASSRGRRTGRITAEPVTPVDLLGVYILLPAMNAGGGLS